MRQSGSFAILEQLANEQRHVLSAWRGLILLRRATFALSTTERRWEQLPGEVTDLAPLLRQMRNRGEIQPIAGFPDVYEITVPYARQGVVDEREVLFELHPYAVLSHLSALTFHGLSDDLPKGLTVTVSADVTGGLLPIGTRPSDWQGVSRPAGRAPEKVAGRPVDFQRVKPERFFGFEEYEPFGYPMRYTTPERTLIDGLQSPKISGGITTVLQAWVRARAVIDLDVLVYQVERFGVAILRQRVGYILDQIGLTHPRVEQWQESTHRGGSSRLVGSEPFVSQFDPRWNLSLNAPVEILHELPV